MKKNLLLFVIAGLLMAAAAHAGTVKSAGVKGLWSQPATWVGNTLPGPNDLVVIANRDTVTMDTTFTVAGITVGEGDSTGLVFSKLKSITIYINGDLTVSPLARFSVQANTIAGVIADSLFITGNITNNGPFFDMKTGTVSAPQTISVCQVCFVGSTVSTIKMGPYITTGNNEFNGIRVNKTGKGKVVLASDVFSAGGSTSAPTADPGVILTRGVVETGPYVFVQQYASSASMTTGSDSSYILGNLGRGISNSNATTERTFQVGDAGGYRPVKVRVTPSGTNVTGHYVRVDVIHGKANPTGTAGFDESIDKVSDVRYYKVSYFRAPVAPTALAKVNVDRFALSYGKDDGVAAGNTNLRIAIADTSKLAWVGLGPTVKPFTTKSGDTLRTMTSDSLPSASWRTIDSVNAVYVALSRLAGTTENTLIDPAVYVRRESNTPGTFSLEQNYPNPFNPATAIRFSVKTAGVVSLKVHDVLGREVAALVDDTMAAGTYTMTWDASRAASGIYFYTLRSGNAVQTKRMTLMK